jgi:chemotaxis response regulator CheB
LQKHPNGHEAIEQFRAHRPDVTLMELQVPNFNGVEAMVTIRGRLCCAVVMQQRGGGVRAEASIPMTKRVFRGAVEDVNGCVQEVLSGMFIPTRLLRIAIRSE